MEITLKRILLGKTYTDGELLIDGKFFCHVVEDKVRAKAGLWKRINKVYAETAIPYGRYPVMSTWSNRFQRILTGIFNVPDFEGIRIHNGTTEKSSAGCLIVSYTRVKEGMLVNDKSAMNDLNFLVESKQKSEKIWITIVDA